MEEQCFIWSVRANGWMTSVATYTSELKDARKLSRAEAIAMCERHFNNNTGDLGLVPVRESDVGFAL